MRVTLVAHDVSTGGGQPRVNLYLVQHLLAQGHAVHVIAGRVESSLHACPGFSAEILPLPHRPLLFRQIAFMLAARGALSRSPNGAIVVTNENSVLASAHLNYSHYCHSAYRRRRVLESRGLRLLPRYAYYFAFDTVNALTEQLAYRRCSRRIVAVSRQLRDELVRDAHAAAGRIWTILNGVDLREFRPAASAEERAAVRGGLGLPAGPLLLFAGDLRSPRKGLDAIVEALPLLPADVHLLIAGEASRSPYPGKVVRAGLADRVTFLGFRRDIAAIMRAADIFVFPTHYEACSLVVLEALASGMAVVTTNRAGSSELIVDGDNGVILANADDGQMLARHIGCLLSDARRRQEMGAAARRSVLGHDWSRVMGEVEALLLDLASEAAV